MPELPADVHRTLRRQLRRLVLSDEAPPRSAAEWTALLSRVSASYRQADDDRYLMERSLEVSSAEMAELYEQLRRSSESRIAVEHARLVGVTEHFPIGILEVDGDGRVAFENPAWQEMCGRSLVGSADPIYAVIDPLDHPAVVAATKAAGAAGPDPTITVRLVGGRRGPRWARLRMRALRADGGPDDHDRWFVSAADVTDEVEARASNERLTALLEAATDVVVVFEPSGRLLHLNRVGRELLGVEKDAELDERSLFELFEPASADRVQRDAFPILHAGGTWRGEVTLVRRGREIPTSLVLLAHADRNGRTEYCSAIARDITELKFAQEALVREATHDTLTGLPNRALLLDRLDHAIRRAQRTNAGLAVLYIDLDRFKLVNDSLGHEVGDRLIVSAAQRLLDAVRTSDTVARLGGDEFVVVAEDFGGPREAMRLASTVVEAFNDPFMLGGSEAFVTASVGIAVRAGPGDTAATLLRDADVAMYRAKEQGRGRHELYDAAMHASVMRRFEIEASLRRAIDRGEIEAHYQPLVEIHTGEIVGFEALARWNRGMPEEAIPPAVFIPLAEETGLINRIGLEMLTQACAAAARWNDPAAHRPPGSGPIGVAVNVSARQLTQPGLLRSVERLARDFRLDPTSLTLEITESVLVHDPAVALARLRALRELGVRIAIDDFGKGYSSLAYLQRFPLDIVKIDQVFVSSLDSSAADRTIVASMVELAHTLGLRVIAEGVERTTQLEVLSELGCDVIQGFVVSPALAVDLATQWVQRGRWSPAPLDVTTV